MTTRLLSALDRVVPGEWKNMVAYRMVVDNYLGPLASCPDNSMISQGFDF